MAAKSKPRRRRMTLERAFGLTLRELRIERGWSQEELSQESGVCTRNYVGMLEAGLHVPSLKMLYGFAAVLDMTPCDFLKRVDELLGLAGG